jgi:hypothetical protein
MAAVLEVCVPVHVRVSVTRCQMQHGMAADVDARQLLASTGLAYHHDFLVKLPSHH